MTREEAIEELELVRFNYNYRINSRMNHTNHFSEALTMTIEALKNMPVCKRLPEENGTVMDYTD